ncbi:protein of unknown function (plasmid) [Cupriavidus taiwanensis]|uniref:Uncharacterized protein n=1 Tax=Cupriavidus taiwanensis TaxID=164546 RepID=A0A9Q7V2I7_9BURK|nr:protein of unknown function [Cupriavidus taiwanensis]
MRTTSGAAGWPAFGASRTLFSLLWVTVPGRTQPSDHRSAVHNRTTRRISLTPEGESYRMEGAASSPRWKRWNASRPLSVSTSTAEQASTDTARPMARQA